MQISVTFRNTESKDILRECVQEKISKLKRYMDYPLEANVVLAVEKHRHLAEITMVANRITINAREEADDMFSAIDGMMEKLERQILKYKDKIKRYKTDSSLPDMNWRVDVYAAGSFDQGAAPKIIKSKKLLAKPMSVEEAAMQMDLLNNDFLVFTNASSKNLNIIYRLKDGNYGLVEPQAE